jgi:hypothetical protein
MPRTIVLHTRLDSTTAAYVRLEADRCGSSFSEWIAAVLRREFHRAGAPDALAAKIYEVSVVGVHLLQALMIDSLGPEAMARTLEKATETGGRRDRGTAGTGRGGRMMIHGCGALGVVQAMDYFRDEYTGGDCYTGDRSGETGTWQGRDAARFARYRSLPTAQPAADQALAAILRREDMRARRNGGLDLDVR